MLTAQFRNARSARLDWAMSNVFGFRRFDPLNLPGVHGEVVRITHLDPLSVARPEAAISAESCGWQCYRASSMLWCLRMTAVCWFSGPNHDSISRLP